jgi:hypothetical protein
MIDAIVDEMLGEVVAEVTVGSQTVLFATSPPMWCGLRTVGDGLANSSISRPTIMANKQGFWLTIMANGPTIIANSLQTTRRTNRHCK